MATISPGNRQSFKSDDLLLRETNHRCSNDLQLVVGLLGLQGRRATSPEVREALADAMNRVSILAEARSALHRERQPSLETALRHVCEALHAQAEPRGILLSLEAHEAQGLSAHQITTLALVANELATNAIKHAFEEGQAGHIRMSLVKNSNNDVVLLVDDDGLPFPEPGSGRDGLGLGLARRLMASIGGLLIPPSGGSKTFELRVPVASH